MPSICERTDTLTDLLSRSDVISLHCPLTDDNRGMINTKTLAYVKPNAILVNTARGGLIDDRSLLAALENRTLQRGAGQLYQRTTDRSAPLAGVENVIISPHIGGVSAASYIKMGTAAASNIVERCGEAEETTLTASR